MVHGGRIIHAAPAPGPDDHISQAGYWLGSTPCIRYRQSLRETTLDDLRDRRSCPSCWPLGTAGTTTGEGEATPA
jgi:hypothetical protein